MLLIKKEQLILFLAPFMSHMAEFIVIEDGNVKFHYFQILVNGWKNAINAFISVPHDRVHYSLAWQAKIELFKFR